MRVANVRPLTPVRRFLYWVEERERVRRRKEAGASLPWTDDEILARYRFCNVRRMDDRVSRWLMDNWYRPYRDHHNMLYAAALARFINLPSSLNSITEWVFGKTVQWQTIKRRLRALRKRGPIFNGAYMVRGNNGVDKVESVVDYNVRPLGALRAAVDPSSFEHTWAALMPSYGLGSFMAGQITADLRWALSGDWADARTFAPLGPGSRRGMNRLQGRPIDTPLTQAQFNEELAEVIGLVVSSLPQEITSRLEAIDIQNCLCEWDKHERALWGEGKPKQTYRPKPNQGFSEEGV